MTGLIAYIMLVPYQSTKNQLDIFVGFGIGIENKKLFWLFLVGKTGRRCVNVKMCVRVTTS